MSSISCTLFFAVLASLVCGGLAGKNWALLIQGSRGWFNYPSQASVCHAYQTLHRAGLPEENIVVMHYDDIAFNESNPFPGTIRNSPNGSDVYKGTPKDYTGKDITKETFLAALTGDEATIVKILGRKGKVINSTADDNIFVFYSDHGDDNIVMMPDDRALHARELNDTLTKMYQNKRYKNLVFFLESCQSGSMFEAVLSPHINVYAMTASDSYDNAAMMFCDDKRFKTCLGGEFSCNWLGDTDVFNLTKTSLNKEYKKVKHTMIHSTPEQYGDLSIGKDMLDEFFGKSNEIGEKPWTKCRHPDMKTIPINMARIFNIKARLSSAPANSKLRADIQEELAEVEQMMENTRSLFLDISRPFFSSMSETLLESKVFVKDHGHLENFQCYEDAIDTLYSMCPQLSPNSNPATVESSGILIYLCNQKKYSDVLESVWRAALKNPMCKPNEPSF